MTYQNLLYELDGPVAIVRVNRPEKLNALSTATLLELEQTVFGNLFDTADQKEGMDAFLNKREPRFTGR